MLILFVWPWLYTPSMPPSLPYPDLLYPPPGKFTPSTNQSFCQIIPAWTRSAVHFAFWSSAVKTPDANPYFVELAISIASSASSKLNTDVTGPNISSWAIVESVLTLSKIVGW